MACGIPGLHSRVRRVHEEMGARTEPEQGRCEAMQMLLDRIAEHVGFVVEDLMAQRAGMGLGDELL